MNNKIPKESLLTISINLEAKQIQIRFFKDTKYQDRSHEQFSHLITFELHHKFRQILISDQISRSPEIFR